MKKLNIKKISFNHLQHIMNFFRENPNPSDSLVHQVAEKHIKAGRIKDVHEFEDAIYAALSSLVPPEGSLIPGGKTDLPKPEDVDHEELAMGIEVEKEHTDREDIAEEIALAHLQELPNYYTLLKKMESEGENGVISSAIGGWFWIYFTGTGNGRWVEAATLKDAKWIFAMKVGLSSISRIQGSKKSFPNKPNKAPEGYIERDWEYLAR